MLWKIEGADKATGKDQVTFVEAKNRQEAEAGGAGLFIASIHEASAEERGVFGSGKGKINWRGSWLSIAALVVALAALAVAILKDGSLLRGRGIGAYDFSTPEKALASGMEAGARGDARALYELGLSADEARRPSELKSLASLKIDRTIAFDGKSAVFYKLTVNGLDEYKVEWMKREDDGKFYHAYESTYGWANESDTERSRVGKAIAAWEAKGAAAN